MRAPGNESVEKLVTDLLHSATNMHLSHFMTQVYSEHIALQEYYEKIVDLVDRLVESVQGLNGKLMTNYTPSVNAFDVNGGAVMYLRNLRSRIGGNRDIFGEDGAVQAIVDDILELMDITVYKLFAFSH